MAVSAVVKGVRTGTERLEGHPVRGPRPFSACIGPSCCTRAPPAASVPPERGSNPLSPESLSLSLSLSSSRAGPGRGAGSPDPYPELRGCTGFSLGRGARWDGGDIRREGLLRKGRSCRSVAGGRPGERSASQVRAPRSSEPHEAEPRPARAGSGALARAPWL